MSESELTVDEITVEVENELALKGAGEDAPADALLDPGAQDAADEITENIETTETEAEEE